MLVNHTSTLWSELAVGDGLTLTPLWADPDSQQQAHDTKPHNHTSQSHLAIGTPMRARCGYVSQDNNIKGRWSSHVSQTGRLYEHAAFGLRCDRILWTRLLVLILFYSLFDNGISYFFWRYGIKHYRISLKINTSFRPKKLDWFNKKMLEPYDIL